MRKPYLRINVLTVFIFIQCLVNCQTLDNKTWISVYAERKDSSIIIDELYSPDTPIIYSLGKGEGTVLISSGSFKIHYTYIGNVFNINNNQRFIVEKLTDSTLTICEANNNGLYDDKINRFYLIENKYLENYLLKEKKIEFENDSIVIANPLFSPNISIGKLLESKIKSYSNGYLYGDILLSPNGEVLNVNILETDNIANKNIDIIKNCIKSSSGNWTMPYSIHKVYYRIKYLIQLTNDNGMSGVIVKFHTRQINSSKDKINKEQAIIEYNKGVEYYNKGKFEKAVSSFSKAIKYDSLYLDAYYNRASINYNLKLFDEACKDWKYLKSLGQKGGEKSYNEKCK